MMSVLSGRSCSSQGSKSCSCVAVCYICSCLPCWHSYLLAQLSYYMWITALVAYFANSAYCLSSSDTVSSNSHQPFCGSWPLAGIWTVCQMYWKPCALSLWWCRVKLTTVAYSALIASFPLAARPFLRVILKCLAMSSRQPNSSRSEYLLCLSAYYTTNLRATLKPSCLRPTILIASLNWQKLCWYIGDHASFPLARWHVGSFLAASGMASYAISFISLDANP